MPHTEPTTVEAVPSPTALFHALSDDTRLRAVVLMGAEGELCVCELTCALGVSQPKASRHLAVLRKTGLVADRRDRVWIYYRLSENAPRWARQTLDAVIHGNAHKSPFLEDRQRLARMPDRPDRCQYKIPASTTDPNKP